MFVFSVAMSGRGRHLLSDSGSNISMFSRNMQSRPLNVIKDLKYEPHMTISSLMQVQHLIQYVEPLPAFDVSFENNLFQKASIMMSES